MVLRAHAVLSRWKALVAHNCFEAVAADLPALHDGPGYAQSAQCHFSRFGQAPALSLPSRRAACFAAASRQLLRALPGMG